MINKLLNQFSNIIKIDDLPSPNEYFGDYGIDFQKIKHLKHDWQFIRNCNNLLSDIAYTPNVKDKLFFHKKCNVPRYKVREWGKAKNISITTKQEKANANFINLKAHIKSHGSIWSSWLIASQLKTFIEINYEVVDGDLKDLVTLLNDNPTLKVCLPSYFNYSGSWITGSLPFNGVRDPKGVKSSLKDLGYKLNTNHITFISTEDYKKYEEIASLSNIYNEIEIIKHINENAAVIDYKMVDQLSVMLDSTDRKNWVLALEIIANCNVNKSIYCILLLLRAYAYKLVTLKEASHVNFKSLIKFLDLPNWKNINFDDIMDVLIDKDVLKLEDVKDILERVKATVTSHTSLFNNHFKINTLTVSDKVKEYFNPEIKVEEKEKHLENSEI
jgi:hypothetical protein